MRLYVDISEFLRTRITTGIQRVIREFLQRAVADEYKINIIYFDIDLKRYQLLDNYEIENFLSDIKSYRFKSKRDIDIFLEPEEERFFFDLDSVWNSCVKREELYPKLKHSGFKIVNLIYDLTPVLLPEYAKDNSRANFPSFLKAVCRHSDLLFFDSESAKNDFFRFKELEGFNRSITSKVVPLGSDFFKEGCVNSVEYSDILKKRYILFVGTIEPRKNHALVLKAFEEIEKDYLDLNLLFIGKTGWKRDAFVKYLYTHPLKDKRVYHLSNVDDMTLELFYQNAFMVTYLSEYEGYGLPVAESLQYANITVTSKNSSMIEVGNSYADYIIENKKEELVELLLLYLNNQNIYERRKKFIKNHYSPHTWSQFYMKFMRELSRV